MAGTGPDLGVLTTSAMSFGSTRTAVNANTRSERKLKIEELNMKIGVSGASGHLGRAVVSELMEHADPIFELGPGEFSETAQHH